MDAMARKDLTLFEEGRFLMLEYRRRFPLGGLFPTQQECKELSRTLDLNLAYINRCLTQFLA